MAPGDLQQLGNATPIGASAPLRAKQRSVIAVAE
jgi:hypothetical protein